MELRVISLGAGVQSSAMLLLADEGKLGHVDAAIFANTLDESRQTYRWLDRLEAAVSIPIHRATRGSLSQETLRSMQETKSGFVPIPTYVLDPEKSRESQGRRQCTRWAKTEVVYRECRRLLGLARGERSTPERVEVLMGISVDEAHRMKPSRYPLLRSAWPLIELGWRRGDCQDYIVERMEAKAPRSSCVYCPFHSDADWIEMKREDPVSFKRACLFEDRMRAIDPTQYLHDSCKPLGEVAFDSSRQLDMFGNDCEGGCGL